MARVTVEDCVLKIPNRFDLVMLAAQRARDIASGTALSIERDNDKNPVVALREIAEETIPLQDLGESLIRGMQKHVESDEPEEDAPEFDVPSIPSAALGQAEELLADALVVEAPLAEDTVEDAVENEDSGDLAEGDPDGQSEDPEDKEQV